MREHHTLTVEPLRGAHRSVGEERTAGQLLEGARAGDLLAWRLLVGRCDGLVRSTARRYRLQDSDVDDVSQVTWLRLLEGADRIQDVAGVKRWLVTVASREALRVLARQRRERAGLESERELPADANGMPETRALDGELHAALHAAVGALPEQRRRLVWTLAGRSASYSEVATALDMPIGSIGPTWQRCIKQLRLEMSAHGYVSGA
jgi:RNA polymerase sigma factor (sigma-70 family)